jgi:hypothetical protein
MLGKSIAAKIVLCAALLCSSAAYAQSGIDLSSSDRAAIWRRLGRDATDTQAAAGLQVGDRVPAPMRVLPFSKQLRKRVPAVAHYAYALLHGEVLIVDRRARRIVAIVYPIDAWGLSFARHWRTDIGRRMICRDISGCLSIAPRATRAS